jgi:cysteine-rich repeat protein
MRIIEGPEGGISIFQYSVGPAASRGGSWLGGRRDGDQVLALNPSVPFPVGLTIAVVSCDLLEARWFSARLGGSEGEPFTVERISSGYCGDGELGPDEECDDGNFRDGDACTLVCRLTRCGDGVRDADEQCDDGDAEDRDGCSTVCKLERPAFPSRCSDLTGTWQVTNGTWNGGPWTFKHTRDGTIDAIYFEPWSTDLIASRIVFTGKERSGRIELFGLRRFFEREGELRLAGSALGCDRMELQPVGRFESYEIPALHVLERVSDSYCGDGVVDPEERCDDGNIEPGDGCSFACTLPVCGDGLIDPAEDCDPGEYSWDATCEGCAREPDGCNLTGTWSGTGELFLGRERYLDGLHVSLVDDGRGGVRGAIAGDALGERSDVWITLEGAHGAGMLWLAVSLRTTQPLDEFVYGLDGVLRGDVQSCDALRIRGATFSRISTGFCGDDRREGAERCDDGNMESGDGCSASCTREKDRTGRVVRRRFLARR